MLEGDFNLVRSVSNKSNCVISHKWTDLFNDWINRWGLIELDPKNRKLTLTNNQDNLIMARIDRVLVSTAWDAANGESRILGQGMPSKKFHKQFSKFILAIR
jgi:hypothetical protein